MQLIDCKKNFTMNIHRRFKLDALSFVTLPLLACEAALKTTRIELLTDINMILFYEKVIRGGVTLCGTK